MLYLTNTFSPMMVGTNCRFIGQEVTLARAEEMLNEGFTSAISHNVTAAVLSGLLGREVVFNRSNLTLNAGDQVIAIIPSFRAAEAREFTREEVMAAPIRCFLIAIVEIAA